MIKNSVAPFINTIKTAKNLRCGGNFFLIANYGSDYSYDMIDMVGGELRLSTFTRPSNCYCWERERIATLEYNLSIPNFGTLIALLRITDPKMYVRWKECNNA